MDKISAVQWWVNGKAMPQPDEFDVEMEDLDASTYRSITTGNLIDNPISRNWTKAKFTFAALTEAEAKSLLAITNMNPIPAKIENPSFPSGYVEANFRVSKKSFKKLKTNKPMYAVSFNMVQKNKVGGM